MGKSLCTVFFRISQDSPATEAGRAVGQLWDMYSELKQGIIKKLEVNKKLLLGGNLSVLLAYGPKIFNIRGIKNKHLESSRKFLL